MALSVVESSELYASKVESALVLGHLALAHFVTSLGPSPHLRNEECRLAVCLGLLLADDLG